MKRIFKLFMIWNFDKEEQWLNDMADQGYCLRFVGLLRYDFDQCTPGSYNYKLELLEHSPTAHESEQYLSFLAETGVEHIGTIMRWVYLRKKKEKGPFELFSDNESRIKHLNRILQFIAVFGGANLIIGLVNLYYALMEKSPLNWINLINFVVAGLLFYGYFKLHKKKKGLEKDRRLYE